MKNLIVTFFLLPLSINAQIVISNSILAANSSCGANYNQTYAKIENFNSKPQFAYTLQNGSGCVFKIRWNQNSNWWELIAENPSQEPPYNISIVSIQDANTNSPQLGGGFQGLVSGPDAALPLIQGESCLGSTISVINNGHNSYSWLNNITPLNSYQNSSLLAGFEGDYSLISRNEHWTGVQNTYGAKPKAVFFIDENTGWMCSESQNYGYIYKTTNGGSSWTVQHSAIFTFFYDIYFTDLNNGIAAGINGQLYRTTNGGSNWAVILPYNFSKGYLYKIFFVNSVVGWCVGSNSTIIKTTDGGLNWTIQLEGNGYTYQSPIYDAHFWDIENGITILNNTDTYKILKTQNGGIDWLEIGNGLGQIFSIHFIDQTIGFISGKKQDGTFQLLKTTNGGNTWSEIPNSSKLPVTIFDSDIHFKNQNEGWVTIYGSKTGIFYTNDGGNNFYQKFHTNSSFSNTRFTDFNFSNDNEKAWIGLFELGFMGSETGRLIKLGQTYSSSNSLKIYPNPSEINLNLTNTNELNLAQALERIISTEGIENNSNKIYRAGNSITLNTGFKVESGAVFKAEIPSCLNP
jgi:photosystem II stability/assembly factor-like uncharacterized protein